METIRKARETMSSRERVARTFARERTDRVPIGYEANPGIHGRLCRRLGVAPDDMAALYDALGVDIAGVGPAFIGENKFPAPPGRRADPVTGAVSRWVEHESGGYWDFCDFPLRGAEADTIARWHVPSPDDFSLESVAEQIAAHPDRAIHIGNAGFADVINSTGRVMGMEDALVNLHLRDEATLRYVKRACALELALLDRLLGRFGGRIDFVWIGEDLGTQHAPMISLETYRAVLRPIHEQYVALAKAYGKPIIAHTCGSSSWVYEDFIAMGIDAVDTLQPEAANMSPRYLKDTFGGRLGFRGCVSTAGPLAYGTPEQVEADVRDTLAVMMPGGGYHFAPTHMVQDNTPTDNLLAMYRAAHAYGVY